jgi:hypothetical protein
MLRMQTQLKTWSLDLYYIYNISINFAYENELLRVLIGLLISKSEALFTTWVVNNAFPKGLTTSRAFFEGDVNTIGKQFSTINS